MKPFQAFLLITLLTPTLPQEIIAQTSTPVVTRVAADKARERNFVYQVKVLDEFMERFNDDKSSYLRQVYKSKKQPFNLSRHKLILSLFNTSKTDVRKPEIDRFITQITGSTPPQLLAITDSNWYAQVACRFTASGRGVTIPVILQVVTTEDSGATWMITGLGDVPILAGARSGEKAGHASEETVNPGKALSPTDYATNFLSLQRVLTPTMNPANYFMPALLRTDRGGAFVQMVKTGRLKFEYTEAPRFHFFQIPNFIFEVRRFDREGTSSGWLIDYLKPATDEQKAMEKARLLQRPL